MRADLLPLAGGDAARQRAAEMIRVAPLVWADILEAAEHGAAYGGMLHPGDQLVLVLAEQRAHGGPGGPDASPVEEIEHGRNRLAPAQHVPPIALGAWRDPSRPTSVRNRAR